MKITRAVRRAKLRIAALAAAAAGLVVPVGQAAAHASAGTAVSS